MLTCGRPKRSHVADQNAPPMTPKAPPPTTHDTPRNRPMTPKAPKTKSPQYILKNQRGINQYLAIIVYIKIYRRKDLTLKNQLTLG